VGTIRVVKRRVKDPLYIKFPESAPPNHKLIIIGAAVLLDFIFFG
jgi:hypothetical protein